MKKISTILSLTLLSIFSLNGAADPTPPTPNPNNEFTELLQTFTAIQKILTFARHHKAQAIDNCGTVNPYYYQTKQGLFLLMAFYPRALWTPWGSISLYGQATDEESKDLLNQSVAFFKYLTLEFKGFDGQYDGTGRFYLAQDDQSFTSLDENKLSMYKGTNQRIYCTCPTFHAVYKVRAVNSAKLPEPIKRTRIEYIPHQEVQQSWQAMTLQHQSLTAIVDQTLSAEPMPADHVM